MTSGSKIKISLFFLVVLASSTFFLMRPFLKDIRESSLQLAQERNNLSALESKIKNLEKFQGEYDKLKPDLEKADSLLVDARLPVDFIRFLEKISSESNINLKISPALSPKIANDPWPSLNFQLAMAGSYPEIIKFIGKLENNDYLVNFQNFDSFGLTDNELKSKEFSKFFPGDVRANMAIKVYAK